MQKEDLDKKNYEISFLLENESSVPDVLRMLGQRSIEMKGEPSIKKIKLAYKIKKFENVCFGFVRVSAFAEDIKALEGDFKNQAVVLRSLVIKLPKEAMEEPRREFDERRPRMATRRQPAQATKQPEALSNEALEKKIEEILQ